MFQQVWWCLRGLGQAAADLWSVKADFWEWFAGASCWVVLLPKGTELPHSTAPHSFPGKLSCASAEFLPLLGIEIDTKWML